MERENKWEENGKKEGKRNRWRERMRETNSGRCITGESAGFAPHLVK